MTKSKITSLELAQLARNALLEKKGEDIAIIDVRGLSDITEYYVIATGNNRPHLKALMDECERILNANRPRAHRHAGKPESGWMVADFWDVIVHVFSHDARKNYALEELWRDGKRVE